MAAQTSASCDVAPQRMPATSQQATALPGMLLIFFAAASQTIGINQKHGVRQECH